jgi:putative FmdB family regulatory protein
MPIFSYKCTKCGSLFERLEGVLRSDEELKCASCGSKDVSRQFSTFSVGKSSSKETEVSPAAPACPGCPGGTCSMM